MIRSPEGTAEYCLEKAHEAFAWKEACIAQATDARMAHDEVMVQMHKDCAVVWGRHMLAWLRAAQRAPLRSELAS